jgi:hypothetical protein
MRSAVGGNSAVSIPEGYHLVIVRNIWQKLSSFERWDRLIIRNFWRLFPRIFGEILLIVRNIWLNPTLDQSFKKTSRLYRPLSPTDEIYKRSGP